MTREMLLRAVRNLEHTASELLAAERGLEPPRVSVRLLAHGEENHEHLHVLVRIDGQDHAEAAGHMATLLRLARRAP